MCEDRSIFLSGLHKNEEPLDISRENLELLNMYIKDIHKSELLTKEEEQDLIPQVQWLCTIPEIAHIVRIVTGHEASLEEALIFLDYEDNDSEVYVVFEDSSIMEEKSRTTQNHWFRRLKHYNN